MAVKSLVPDFDALGTDKVFSCVYELVTDDVAENERDRSFVIEGPDRVRDGVPRVLLIV